MAFQSQIALGELTDLADTAESAARAAEVLTQYLTLDDEARIYVDEARSCFNQALVRINNARFIIENTEQNEAS